VLKLIDRTEATAVLDAPWKHVEEITDGRNPQLGEERRPRRSDPSGVADRCIGIQGPGGRGPVFWGSLARPVHCGGNSTLRTLSLLAPV
jgi:hypothetical protein